MTEQGGELLPKHYQEGNDPIREVGLRREADAHRIEAEISSLTTRLNEIPEFRREPDGTASSYVEGMISRRAELLRQLRPTPGPSSDVRADPVKSLLTSIHHFVNPWTVLRLPDMSEGIHVTPGTPGTSGDIETGGLSPGGLGYGGHPDDDGTEDPYLPKFWSHNWTCSVVFPEAPYSGWLFYRFDVDSSCNIYQAPANAGVVMEYVTIGKTADILAQSPFADGALEPVGWPVQVTLPTPIPPLLTRPPYRSSAQ